MFGRFRVVLTALATSSLPLAALAQTAPPADTTIDAQTLWPAPGPAEFVGVRSSAISPNRGVGFSLALSFQRRPIVLVDPSTATISDVVSQQLGADVLWSYGILDRAQVGLALPVIVEQTGDGARAVTGSEVPLQTLAVRDLRVEVKGLLWGRPAPGARGFALAAVLGASLPTGDAASFASDRSAVLWPVVIADYHRARASFALNLGARLRATSALADTQIGSQLVVGAAAGYAVARGRLRGFVEYEALVGLVERSGAPMDLVAGARWAFDAAGSVSVVAAIGGGVHHLLRAAGVDLWTPPLEPGLRLFAALTYAPRAPAPAAADSGRAP